MTIDISIKNGCVDALASFIARGGMLGLEDIQEIAEWCKEQERFAGTNAEKHFLLAARAFLLDYEAETSDNPPEHLGYEREPMNEIIARAEDANGR